MQTILRALAPPAPAHRTVVPAIPGRFLPRSFSSSSDAWLIFTLQAAEPHCLLGAAPASTQTSGLPTPGRHPVTLRIAHKAMIAVCNYFVF